MLEKDEWSMGEREKIKGKNAGKKREGRKSFWCIFLLNVDISYKLLH